MTRHVTETELQDAVIELAQRLGYLVHHDRPARDRDGNWSTHIQGDAGFPDLVLVHKTTHTVIFAELKSIRGKASDDQLEWLLALPQKDANPRLPIIGETSSYLWDPIHWGPGGGMINLILHHGAGRQPSYPDPDSERETAT